MHTHVFNLAELECDDRLWQACEDLHNAIMKDIIAANANTSVLRSDKFIDQCNALLDLVIVFEKQKKCITPIKLNPGKVSTFEIVAGVKMAVVEEGDIRFLFKYDHAAKKYLFHHYERR